MNHFVTFYSPGANFPQPEMTVTPIDVLDVDEAVTMARTVRERGNARPYAFRFSTRDAEDNVIDEGRLYWLGGTVETSAEIEARDDPNEEILRTNMQENRYTRIITNTNTASFPVTQQLARTDIVLDVEL